MVSNTNCVSFRSALLVFLAMMFAGFTVAQPPDSSFDTGLGGNSSIVGSVYTPSGQRMQRRIRVRLVTMTIGERTSMTDDDGNFSFRGLVSGNYTVIIDGEKEYEPYTQNVNIIQLRNAPPQVNTLSVRLTTKKNAEPKPGVINADFADVPTKALAFYKTAVDMVKLQDHKAAIAQLVLATKEYPNFVIAYNDLGVEYLRLNDLERADAAFRSALKVKPDALQPMINLGIVLFNENRFDEAEPFFKDAIKLKEDSAIGHFFLGRTVASLGRFDEAVKELVTSVTLGGDNMKEAHRYLAIIYNAKGDKKKAASELEIYLRLVPNAPDAEQLKQVMEKLKNTE